eukprot:369479-Pyramimonas_sp.AAC.1
MGVPKLVRVPRESSATGTLGGAPLWGHEACESCVPEWVWVPHASSATGTLGGAPYGTTKRVR